MTMPMGDELVHFPKRSPANFTTERKIAASSTNPTGLAYDRAVWGNEPVPDISDRELSRLEGKYRSLLASPNHAVLLRSRLRNRAQLLRVAISPSEVGGLLEDPRLVPSGISDARSEMSAGREAEAYVRRGDVEQLMADHLMAALNPPNAWLHVVDRPLERPVPLGLVIADLADHDRAREDARVIELLGDAAP